MHFSGFTAEKHGKSSGYKKSSIQCTPQAISLSFSSVTTNIEWH